MANRIDQIRSYIDGRRRAYVNIFQGPNGEKVLEDLAHFCRANESTFNVDPAIAANLEGRREVFLRIQQHLNLSPEDLFQLVTGNSNTTTKG